MSSSRSTQSTSVFTFPCIPLFTFLIIIAITSADHSRVSSISSSAQLHALRQSSAAANLAMSHTILSQSTLSSSNNVGETALPSSCASLSRDAAVEKEEDCRKSCSSVGGCSRLRGGGKRRCQHPGCREPYMAVAGDCLYCPLKLCSSHRLPEDHGCRNIQTCRQEAFNANFIRLTEEARGVHARPESMVRESE
mmetsp:Transcript_56562/g.115811  ORF Transcript_56562/g.115811 Transcript_56562/m.115811 type:complete len:194 (+) Transcript_56562:518-1099(+)